MLVHGVPTGCPWVTYEFVVLTHGSPMDHNGFRILDHGPPMSRAWGHSFSPRATHRSRMDQPWVAYGRGMLAHG